MKIAAFVHPWRCTHPLGGVGRHAAEVLRALGVEKEVEIELLVSKQWIGAGGKLEAGTMLPDFPVRRIPLRENFAERCWKTLGWPKVDRWVRGSDWVYSPMETHLPARRVPVAVTIHDMQMFETSLPWSHTSHQRRWRAKWNVWIRKALRDSRVVFTVSEFSKSRMVDLLGADPAKIVVVGNGVGPEFFAIKRDDNPTTEPYALVLGGLRRKKGGAEVIAVARELGARRVALKVIVAGINDADLVERASDVANLDVRGAVSEGGLHQLLGGASSLLFLSPYEGFGLPALEAMAAGIPVVAANRAALPEAVGSAGVLVEPEQAREIADTLLELDRDPIRRASLVAEGRTRATEHSWGRCADRLSQAFKSFA